VRRLPPGQHKVRSQSGRRRNKRGLHPPVAPRGPFTWLAADTAFATVGVIPCPVTGGTSVVAGAAAAGVFIGFVAVLAIYDFIRRMTCIGDSWRLGGPGFSEKMRAVSRTLHRRNLNREEIIVLPRGL
jgi:hypothetical protein